jgi:hypothetical protein
MTPEAYTALVILSSFGKVDSCFLPQLDEIKIAIEQIIAK